MIRLVLLGAGGRMGRAVEAAAAAAEDVTIKARLGRAGALAPGPAATSSEPAARGTGYQGVPEQAGGDPPAARLRLLEVLGRGDVVVDFSSPEATRAAATACAERGAALVSGTTGLGPEEEAALAEAARRVAVLSAPNFSLGVAALRRALAAALQGLGGAWDIEIVERHHRLKADSPSGTALRLVQDVQTLRGEAQLRHGRQGRPGPRPAGEIGVHAVRGGTWAGDHAVLIAGTGEWLELRHVAQDRGAFAQGALAAARFVATAPAGLYTLDSLLQLPS